VLSSHNENSKINQDIIKHKTKVLEFDDIKTMSMSRVHLKREFTFNPKRKKVSYAW